jgi:hypothetical protein
MIAGRKRRGRHEMTWERELEKVLKQKKLTPEDEVNRQIWRKRQRNSNRCNNIKFLKKIN